KWRDAEHARTPRFPWPARRIWAARAPAREGANSAIRAKKKGRSSTDPEGCGKRRVGPLQVRTVSPGIPALVELIHKARRPLGRRRLSRADRSHDAEPQGRSDGEDRATEENGEAENTHERNA